MVELVRAHRLVTLTGVGGVGKTRLALQVAGELTGEFPDGVWLVELAPVGDPAALPDVVAAVLGHHPPGRADGDRGIAQALRAGACWWCWTTVSTCSTRPPIWSRPSWPARPR